MNGKTPYEHCWNGRVTRETLSYLCRKVVKGNVRGSESVISGNGVCFGKYDKTSGNAPVDVLESPFFEIAIERVNTAGKGATVMGAAERFGDERSQVGSRINSR